MTVGQFRIARLLFIFVLTTAPTALAGPPQATETWSNPIVYQGKLDSPLVEVTPFVFNDRLYRLENWQKQWEPPHSENNTRFAEDEVRIRDMATDDIVATPLIGHGLGMAFVHEGRVYVFAGNWGTEKKWQINEIVMVSSADLSTWTQPQVVLRANADERFFNVSVCQGDDQFIMLVESNAPRWPSFTFKYFQSDDLMNWHQVPDAYYGEEKYVGGPALYYIGDFYYTLYLQSLGKGFYETRVTRSRDLIHWQDAPDDRPFATFKRGNPVHPLRPAEIRETNASDVELCHWQDKTIIYYTGGDQQFAGDLQQAEFGGTPQELLESFYREPTLTTPSARQLRYQDNQLGCFVHFGLTSFVGGDDYLATPPTDIFNPDRLDAEQWVIAAKSIGAKHIILTAKHHGGFCLWPTKTTAYSVANAPWRNGTGDVVRDFVEAARKHDIAPGLYFSAGDMHQQCYATPEPRGIRSANGDVDAYFKVFMEQLEELLTNYGELAVVWFDGAYNPFDSDVLDADGNATGDRYSRKITDIVRRLQPDAALMGALHSDVRWSGSEQGLAAYPLWNVVDPGEGRAHWLPDDATGWFIPEANVHTRQHWFWSPNSDETLKTPDEMLSIYYNSIGQGANLLVNLAPDPAGVVPEAETRMLEQFGTELANQYASSVGEIEAPSWDEGHTITLPFNNPKTVNRLLIQEDLKHGQRIRGYRIEVLEDGKWRTAKEGSSIGHTRIEVLDPPIETDGIRLKVTDSVPLPHIASIEAFGPR